MDTLSSDILAYTLIPYLTDTDLFCGLVRLSKQYETYKKYHRVITKPVHIWETLKLKHLTFASVIVDQRYQNSYKYIQEKVTQLSIDMNMGYGFAIPEIPEHVKHLRILNHKQMTIYVNKSLRHIETLEFVKEDFFNCGDLLSRMVLDTVIVNKAKANDFLNGFMISNRVNRLIVRDSIHLSCLNSVQMKDVIVYMDRIECSPDYLRRIRKCGGYWVRKMKELHLKHWDRKFLPIERISPFVQFYVDGTLYNKDKYLDPNTTQTF